MNASRTTSQGAAIGIEEPTTLSPIICWTRMQAEAGQDIKTIILRKEMERKAGHGMFCWGIGNAPPRSIGELARNGGDVDVVFSVMKSRPKASDVHPDGLVVWRSFFDADGIEHDLPPNMLVTSSRKKGARAHYALMCYTDRQLTLADHGPFDPTAYRNVSETARPVGASQVTALLRRVSMEADAAFYRVNLRAKLANSYWVKLGDPIEIQGQQRSALSEISKNFGDVTNSDWVRVASSIRYQNSGARKKSGGQLHLFAV